jgi:hypothetical protein
VAYITGNGLKTQEAVIDAVGSPVRIEPSLSAFEETFKPNKTGAAPQPDRQAGGNQGSPHGA